MGPTLEFQALLAQLARFYRENETSLSAAQVSKCQERLPASDVSALDRLFGLFLYQTQQVRDFGIAVPPRVHAHFSNQPIETGFCDFTLGPRLLPPKVTQTPKSSLLDM